jgi:hypothetical protein
LAIKPEHPKNNTNQTTARPKKGTCPFFNTSCIAALLIFIGMAIQDVLKKGQVPFFGRAVVWLVLFLGCSGFIAKGVIQVFWQGAGVS